MSSEDRREEADQVEEMRDEDMSSVSDATPKEAGEGPAEEDTEKRMEEELAALQADLERACVERDQYLDHMRRLKAELDNSRKRMERERSRIVQMASENLVKELLPVLDNLERALESTGDISEGVRATRDQLLHILQREGLTPIASDGQHFDPVVHEAVMGQPAEEQKEDTVIQTLQKGYLLNGKPIRPAKVVVAK